MMRFFKLLGIEQYGKHIDGHGQRVDCTRHFNPVESILKRILTNRTSFIRFVTHVRKYNGWTDNPSGVRMSYEFAENGRSVTVRVHTDQGTIAQTLNLRPDEQ